MLVRYYEKCLGFIFATSLIHMFLMYNPKGRTISSASIIRSTYLIFVGLCLTVKYLQARKGA